MNVTLFKRYGLLGFLPILFFAEGCSRGHEMSMDVTGQIEAVTVAAGSRVGGRISEVLVDEGARVKQGDVLVRFEATEAQAAFAAAEARLAQADALLKKLEAGARPEELQQAIAAAARAQEQYQLAQKGFRTQEVKGATATAEAVQAQRDEARAEFRRVEKLRDGGAISQQRYDEAKHALEAAEAQYRAAHEKQNLAASGSRKEEIAMAKASAEQAAAALDLVRNGARKEDVDAARGARDAAAADRARAQVTLDEMQVKAPRDAVVESMDVHPGDLLKPGAVALLADPDDLKVMVYVSAPLLGRIKVGQKLSLTADAYGQERFEGIVDRLATEGEYTPRNLQTKEERVQQVFGVKLKLTSQGGRLKAGMTVTAHIPDAVPTDAAQ